LALAPNLDSRIHRGQCLQHALSFTVIGYYHRADIFLSSGKPQVALAQPMALALNLKERYRSALLWTRRETRIPFRYADTSRTCSLALSTTVIAYFHRADIFLSSGKPRVVLAQPALALSLLADNDCSFRLQLLLDHLTALTLSSAAASHESC